MSNPWYTIFGPQDWDGVIINTGNKKIDGKYYNVIGDRNVQLSASGTMWLVGGSGIQLVSQGFVDASGIRAKSLNFETLQKIDSSGNSIDTYSGPSGAIVYKSNNDTLSAIPGGLLNYTSGLLTMPNMPYGPLYVTSGNSNTHEIKSYPSIEYISPVSSGDFGKVIINSLTQFTSGVIISPEFESYKGSILTHMGSGQPVEWQAATYLNADGVLWNRYPKRPVRIENDRIIFYENKPKWAQNWVDSPSLSTLAKEFGTGFDTIAVVRNDTREVTYIKLAAEIRYGADNTSPDVITPLSALFEKVEAIQDPSDPTYNGAGYVAKFCTPLSVNPAVPIIFTDPPIINRTVFISNGYAYSVSKGAYMDMQLGRDATSQFSCDRDTVSSSPYKFKPSTMNSISIRPNIHTAFNMLGENIDFVVYGQYKTIYGNYDSNIFGLDSNNLPTGLIPAFRVDANILNAVSGNPSSGVFFTKFLDRARVNPTGYNFDNKAKILINTNNAYLIDSIPTGTGLVDNVVVTGYVGTYADVTINSTLYSSNVIADNLYLRPKPNSNNTSAYIANALLTVDRSGKIISRIPKTNPTVPGAPSNIMLDPGHTNGIGNSEISLTWTAPNNDGNSDIINYVIQFSTNDGASWTEIPNNLYQVNKATSTSTYATIIGLSPLTAHKFRIAAQNSVGIGSYSIASDNIVAGSSVPKSPYNLTQYRLFDSTDYSDIVLSWEDSQGGADNILGYTIEESSDAGKTWYYYNLPSALISSTSERISGTESKNNYYYRVSSWNSYGQSSFAYIYSSGNYIPDISLTDTTDVLSNWDFGLVLFTGVCPV